MSEGDITRLNRMYKCDELGEKKDQTDLKLAEFDESNKKTSESQPKDVENTKEKSPIDEKSKEKKTTVDTMNNEREVANIMKKMSTSPVRAASNIIVENKSLIPDFLNKIMNLLLTLRGFMTKFVQFIDLIMQ